MSMSQENAGRASSGSGGPLRSSSVGEPAQIVSVAGFAVAAGVRDQKVTIDKTFIICDFLSAGDLQTLAPLENFHVFAGLEKALVGSGVEPGEAAAQ